MAVLAELLFRQCNAAIPIVDVGTDVFAFRDTREEVARIQVKTAQGERYKTEEGYSAQFHIPKKQLSLPDRPPLHYVLAARVAGQWVDFLVISRPALEGYWNGPRRFGTEDRTDLVLTIQFRPEGVLCGEVDLTGHRSAWEALPPFRSGLSAAGAAGGRTGTDPASAGQTAAEPPGEERPPHP
jgi:hypothetical protein